MKMKIDISYRKNNHPKQIMDLFIPEGNANGRAIFFVHGGGWRSGSSEQWHKHAEYFCNKGYTCASAGYRLAPDAKFPDLVEDVRLAMSVFRSRANELGFSADRIAAQGSSAGGHLVAILATMSENDSLGVSDELKIRDTRPNAVICYCPVLDLHEGSRDTISGSILDLLGKRESDDDDLYKQASPVDRVLGYEPPFLFLHGDADEVVPHAQSIDMAEKLRNVGVEADVVILPGVKHGFGYGVTSEAQRTSLQHAEAFLEKTLCA